MNHFIHIYGAREHNLKNIDLKIPRSQLVVITGLSGSGKSSLAFDTIYAEGRRRYLDTLSAYSRQFLGTLQRPKVDKIEGLSPVIAIEQKTISKNPRSTVGTITEIYDLLRVLYARIAEAYSYNSGEKMISYSEEKILSLIKADYKEKKISILSPLIQSRKGNYQEFLRNFQKKGFLKVRINNQIQELVEGLALDRYKTHDIELVVDRLEILPNQEDENRLKNSISLALKHGKGTLMILEENLNEPKFFSKNLSCPITGLSYQDPEPNTFSFNSPKGACSNCKGLGQIKEIILEKLIPDTHKSIYDGGIEWVGTYKKNFIFTELELLAKKLKFNLKSPIKELSAEVLNFIFYGKKNTDKLKKIDFGQFKGLVFYFSQLENENFAVEKVDKFESYFNQKTCPECKGDRLKKTSLFFKIKDKTISQLAKLELSSLKKWIDELEGILSDREKKIAEELLKELAKKINFLLEIGLDYLSLNRASGSLSGGEAQRIRLSSAISSELSNVLYILDEPSIGLHQRDNEKLFSSLKNLVDLGNSVLVVEHDREMIEKADHIIDIGPGPGKKGGEVIFNGSVQELSTSNTLTARYIRGELEVASSIKNPIKEKKEQNYLYLKGASGNNLKNVDLSIPLGKLVCITGVSGSGKSSLVLQTLAPILSKHFYRAEKIPLPYFSIEGLEHLDKMVSIDQSPIGRTPRSNPATYIGVFSEIRRLFSQTLEAKIRGYQAGRFSFNLKEGRCPECQGGGLQAIEMNFLPSVHIMCQKCQGKRFNKETLEIRYKGKNISEILEMKIEEAADFFEPISKIYLPLKCLIEVGLGYLSLGQSSTTLSGGEAQRIKLASELSKRGTGSTIYMLDECTTGLHFEDIKKLVNLLRKLVDLGNTVLVIEHNLDFIKASDYIIDMGPEGGGKGGQIIAEGLLSEIAKNSKSQTGKFFLN